MSFLEWLESNCHHLRTDPWVLHQCTRWISSERTTLEELEGSQFMWQSALRFVTALSEAQTSADNRRRRTSPHPLAVDVLQEVPEVCQLKIWSFPDGKSKKTLETQREDWKIESKKLPFVSTWRLPGSRHVLQGGGKLLCSDRHPPSESSCIVTGCHRLLLLVTGCRCHRFSLGLSAYMCS